MPRDNVSGFTGLTGGWSGGERALKDFAEEARKEGLGYISGKGLVTSLDAVPVDEEAVAIDDRCALAPLWSGLRLACGSNFSGPLAPLPAAADARVVRCFPTAGQASGGGAEVDQGDGIRLAYRCNRRAGRWRDSAEGASGAVSAGGGGQEAPGQVRVRVAAAAWHTVQLTMAHALVTGMNAFVKNTEHKMYGATGIVQRVTDGNVQVLFEGGNWDKTITFDLSEVHPASDRPDDKELVPRPTRRTLMMDGAFAG
eukprot:scaffold3795_cov334-Prasinococcus_capsulatus_cf.AAC.5